MNVQSLITYLKEKIEFHHKQMVKYKDNDLAFNRHDAYAVAYENVLNRVEGK